MEGGPPDFPPDFSCPVVLWILPAFQIFRVRDYYPLWSRLSIRSFHYIRPCITQSVTPENSRSQVWPVPLSLATTYGISPLISSPEGT